MKGYKIRNKSNQLLSINVRDEHGRVRGVHLSPAGKSGSVTEEYELLSEYELSSSNVKGLLQRGLIEVISVESEPVKTKRKSTAIVEV